MQTNANSSWIETYLVPFANRLSRQQHLKAIQSAFLTAMPLMMIGSFALILAEPPISYQTMSTTNIFYGFMEGWANFGAVAAPSLNALFNATLGALSIYVALGIAYFLSEHYKKETFIPLVTTFIVFLLLNSKKIEGGFSSQYFDGSGLFAALLVGILTTEAYHFLVDRKVGAIKLPENVPPALANSFESLVPITLISVLALFISLFFSEVLNTTFPAYVLSAIAPLIKFIDNVFGVGLVSILQQVLWWFGIHDSAVGAILSPIRNSNFAMNAAAYAAHTAPADLPYVFTSPFWWVFVTIGGSGATFALAVLLLRAKSKQLKTVGELAIVPAFFNINEPILFGVPIILNPLFLIPFLSAQTLNAIITYLCMAGGLVNKTFIEPGWNMFAPIGALIATLDYRAAVLVLLLIVLDGLIYYPFLRAWDKNLCAQE